MPLLVVFVYVVYGTLPGKLLTGMVERRFWCLDTAIDRDITYAHDRVVESIILVIAWLGLNDGFISGH